MENIDNNEKKQKNAKLYDRLVLRENLILSVYPDYEKAPDGIQKEIMSIHVIKNCLLNGATRTMKGSKYIEQYDVYVDEFEEEKFKTTMATMGNERLMNEKYITKEQEESFTMPSKDSTALVEQLSNVDVNNNDEYYKVRDKVTDIIRTSTWDDYFELSSKLRQIDDNRAAKFADEKRAKEAARVQHLEAFRKAQERYSQLSIFGKLKSIIQKKDIRHIDARDFSTEELNNMYVTSGRTK